MVEKSKLTIAAEIAAIVGASLCAVGVFIAWLAYKDAHNPKTAAASAVAVMTISGWTAYLFIAALICSIAASAMFFIASRKRHETLEQCKSELYESAKRNLEYREKIAELWSDAVLDSDPLVYPQFIDDRPNGSDRRELQAYFALVNRGNSEARNMVLDPIEMHGKIVQFTRQRMTAPLLPKREAYFYPDVVTKENKSVSTGWDQDLFHLFYMDYHALNDPTLIEAATAVRATYQDSAHNLYEVTCELVLDPAAHNAVRIGNRGASPVIFTRNHKFRKIARAI